ncbi:hypothetical protein L1987_27754 [Smallanthus sonchifolius]|uniref:Uncharacterized protein n=1 Tax=Smallanthus sonchifolius TaxID=185202 RepID=A0ACB9IAW7_9ASTR|nr:hypothetical protein L1987_27754 [Smallanthus sonchifolius]
MPKPLPRHRKNVEGEGQVKLKRSSQIYPREDNLGHWRNGILSLSAEAPGPLRSSDKTYHGTNNELRELPAVELPTLPKILEKLSKELHRQLFDLL